ncbi:hypothetical protein [Bradyrhizobium sp. STM 3843]|uniref:hypothetical protein n=1 Tax=Bradyrhizobium sp. STM 3843 TaxID=551947 RepID=UPI0003089EA4|nr:hypothetical protein [Bradyrhizobium sp. STM 3843]
MKRELNGEERILGEFPGSPNERSLSCSQDGQTIAALDAQNSTLFLMRGAETALYRFSRFWAFSNVGRYSFLSPDGKSITLAETPSLISGANLLRDITIFPNGTSNVFFMNDYLYVDLQEGMQKYAAADGGWAERVAKFKRPTGFDASEIIRCGGHDVVSLVGSESSRYMVIADVPGSQDWLGQTGIRKLFRKHNTPVLISGGYGTCGFPLLDHKRWNATIGLASLDASGVQTYSLPYPEIRLINDDISFSKDGCFVLIQGFWLGQQGPDNTHLLAVQSQRCQ